MVYKTFRIVFMRETRNTKIKELNFYKYLFLV